jgi:hypothetical protein
MPVRSTQYRVDTSKPFDRNGFPGVEIHVLIDAEEDRSQVRTPAAACRRRAVCASATPPSYPRVKSDGVGQPGLPYW